jgi:hypothetical protein
MFCIIILNTIGPVPVFTQYEAQAAASLKSKGFWGGLGDRLLGGIDFLTSKFSL